MHVRMQTYAYTNKNNYAHIHVGLHKDTVT